MKRTLAAIFVTATICMIQIAQAGTQFEGKDAWIEPAFVRLKGDGLLVGYPDGLHGRRSLTPSEIAVSIKATCERLANILDWVDRELDGLTQTGGDLVSPDLAAKTEALLADLSGMTVWQTDADLLRRLLIRFSVEVQKLGGDVPEMLREVSAFRTRTAGMRERARVVAAKTTPIADTPKTHWIYEAFQGLKNGGVPLAADSDVFEGVHHHPGVPSRAALGLAAAFGCKHLIAHSSNVRERIAALKAAVRPGMTEAQLARAKDELTALEKEVDALDWWPQEVPRLKRLIDFFAYEIRLSGTDPEGLKKELDALR
jgi:hypothetical protein